MKKKILIVKPLFDSPMTEVFFNMANSTLNGPDFKVIPNMKINNDKRITNSDITKLDINQVFVFGSNEGGNHGKGAAKTAMKWGAKWGQSEGIQGRTYGIPTKPRDLRQVLSIVQIKPYVDKFIAYAKEHPELTFLVTEIGTGYSKYKPKDIAPLFEEAIEIQNIHLPARFWHKLLNL